MIAMISSTQLSSHILTLLHVKRVKFSFDNVLLCWIRHFLLHLIGNIIHLSQSRKIKKSFHLTQN